MIADRKPLMERNFTICERSQHRVNGVPVVKLGMHEAFLILARRVSFTRFKSEITKYCVTGFFFYYGEIEFETN